MRAKVFLVLLFELGRLVKTHESAPESSSTGKRRFLHLKPEFNEEG